MEAMNPERRGELLASYQRFRKIGRRLNPALVETLDREAIDEAGRRLGILREGTLCFDTEDTASVLMDYGIHQVRRGGRNAVERYLEKSPPPPDSDEMTLLKSMCRVRHSLFQVEEVYRNFGIQVCDILRDESWLLIDVGFSQTAQRHLVLASHVHRPDDFWMTTGAALPLTAETLERVVGQIERRFGKTAEDFRTLSREQETELATRIIRTCLEEGMSQRVSYTHPQFSHGHRSHAVPAPKGLRVGRNDPCPCGSGRKFKNCCRR